MAWSLLYLFDFTSFCWLCNHFPPAVPPPPTPTHPRHTGFFLVELIELIIGIPTARPLSYCPLSWHTLLSPHPHMSAWLTHSWPTSNLLTWSSQTSTERAVLSSSPPFPKPASFSFVVPCTLLHPVLCYLNLSWRQSLDNLTLRTVCINLILFAGDVKMCTFISIFTQRFWAWLS